MKARHPFRKLNIIALLLLPILIVGFVLTGYNTKQLKSHYRQITRAGNDSVRAFIYDLTSGIPHVADLIENSGDFRKLCQHGYDSSDEVYRDLNAFDRSMETYLNDSRILSIDLYSENATLPDNTLIHSIDKNAEDSHWYVRSESGRIPFWSVEDRTLPTGSAIRALVYHRSVYLADAGVRAYIAISVNPNTMRSRLRNNEIDTVIWLKDSGVFYSEVEDAWSEDTKSSADAASSPEAVQTAGQGSEEDSFLRLFQENLGASKNTAWDGIASLYGSKAFASVCVLKPESLTDRFVIASADWNGYRELKIMELMYGILFAAMVILFLLLLYLFLLRRLDRQRQEAYRAALREQEMKTEQSRMEFRMLSSQINPHFLFNTLESIRMRAVRNGDRETADSIKLLGRSMRYALRGSVEGRTTLQDELDYIHTYMDIMHLRFHDNILLTERIQKGLEPPKVSFIPLLVQPIVENGILHGLSEREEGGTIILHISSRPHGTENRHAAAHPLSPADAGMLPESTPDLVIDVYDNGEGMTPEQLQGLRANIYSHPKHESRHIGLANIQKRISLAYGSGYGLSVSSRRGLGTWVRLTIPLQGSAGTV